MEQDGRIEIQKKELRKQMLALRDALPTKEKEAADRQRADRLFDMPEYQRAGLILSYVSFRSEADTHALLRRALSEQRRVAVPRVCGRQMVFCQIASLEDLEPGYSGIWEPRAGCQRVEPCADTPEQTLFVVPGAAFDAEGGRIGYGGGFYDRYLQEHPMQNCVALAYEAQLIRQVPREPHDFCVNWIVTEKRVISCRMTEK